MNKQSVVLPGDQGTWGSYISKYQPDSSKVLDNMFTAGSKNFVTDQTGMIDKRQGGIQWNRTAFSEAAKDTYEAVFESGARHFLRVGGGVLSASTGTGLFDVITSGYSALGNFEWATYQNRSYGCNGINAPQTYDIATSYGGVSYSFTTAKTKVMGAQAPVTAPTAAAPSAGGAVPVGAHRYKVTFVYYSSEESNGSTASAVQTTTAGTQTIALSAIPVGGYGVTARNIYRDNNDGVYLLLDTIANNTATTYTDILLIGSTPTPVPAFNNPPPTFGKIALWNDSLFIAPTGETSLIRFSNAGAPDVFDPDNVIPCQSDDVVTALYVYNGKMYVFGLHSFGSIEGNTPDTYFYHNISKLVGCVDNRSIQVRSIVSVPTLWWLSDKGFYFSNGNTVEYGSDFIQDLVNLNLAQVNYSTNKSTQTSDADFAGDTRSPGILIGSDPGGTSGSVTTINPEATYSRAVDWNSGTLTNAYVLGDTLALPTLYAPTLASGSLTRTVISGPNVQLSTSSYNTSISGTLNLAGRSGSFLTDFTAPSPASVLTNATFPAISYSGSLSVPGTVTAEIWKDVGGSPVTLLFSSVVGSVSSVPVSFGATTLTVNISVTPGDRYWIGYRTTCTASAGALDKSASNLPGGTFGGKYPISIGFIATSGTWVSPVYDTKTATLTGSGLQLYLTAAYGTGATSSVVVQGSVNGSTWVTTDTLANPNGTIALTGGSYRYWQITYNLAASASGNVLLSAPTLTFNVNGTWVSPAINATTDNIAWAALTYTANAPLGTTVAVTIATSSDNITYSSFGPVGSAAVTAWAKIKVAMTTNGGNSVSPSVVSATLDWNLTSTITSSIIDTGTTPAGYNVAQWEQLNLSVGSVLFYVRTAASSGAIPAATFVLVANGEFPAVAALQYVQWKAVISSTANAVPEITSVTVSWFVSTGTVGVRCASIFYNKTYSISVATVGATANNTLIQLDQFGNWRVQKDTSVGTFLSYLNTLYFTDGMSGLIFNGFIANTDNGVAIVMDARTKAWNSNNDLFLKVPRAFKVTGKNTGTTIHTYYSVDRGSTWIEMLNEMGVPGFTTSTDGSTYTVLFVPDATTLDSGRTLMYRLVSDDIYPCSILNYVPSFYSRKGRYLSNG